MRGTAENAAGRTREILEQSGALLSGHFLLSSGLHSDRYCQCARALEYPALAVELAGMMASRLEGEVECDVVVAPALGGVVWGFALAQAMGVRSIFAERSDGHEFALRRGFEIQPGERALLAEDVVTTGTSVMEVARLVESLGGRIAGFASIVDRSGRQFEPGAPFHALTGLEFRTYEAGACPLCAEGDQPVKPGSRRMNKGA